MVNALRLPESTSLWQSADSAVRSDGNVLPDALRDTGRQWQVDGLRAGGQARECRVVACLEFRVG